MTEKIKKDKIDVALSKTYFENNSKNKTLKLTGDKKTGLSKDKKSNAFLFLSALVLLGAILLSAHIFKGTDTLSGTKTASSPSEKYTADAPLSALKTEKILYNFEVDEEGWEIPSWVGSDV